MKIGDYEIHSIETGTFALDGGAMFGIVPKTIWDKKLTADESNRIDMALRCMLITGNNRNILVDTGIGNKFPKKYAEIYKIHHDETNIGTSLKKHGLSINDITDVILTHFHFDHAGGATCFSDGDLKPAFPNATYYIQKDNIDLAYNPSEKDIGSYREENFEPLKESNKLEILKGEIEIFPNISIFVSNGHTIGLQHVKVSADDKTIVYCSDMIPTTAHLPIPYVMGYDLFPLTTIEEKKRFFYKAAEGDWMLFFEHDPYIEAIKVRKGEKGFEIKETVEL